MDEWIAKLEGMLPFALTQSLEGNGALRWILVLGVTLGVAVSLRLLQSVASRFLRRWAERTPTPVDDVYVDVLDSTAWFTHFLLGGLAARPLVELSPRLQFWASSACFLLAALQIALWSQTALSCGLQAWTQRSEKSRAGTVAGALRFIGRLLIWTVALLVVLSSWGIEVTTLVAGLGVGGVAAALAVQSLLGDLIAGLSLFFDRPFDIGDFIIVGDVLGNVDKVGLRTTRIRSLSGEQVIYPNGELTKSLIRNYHRMEERRVVFAFGIEYNVAAETIERAQAIAQESVEAQQDVRFDRAHFKSYGAYSLDFEVVFYVLSRDYNVYMQKQHDVNLHLYRRFQEEGIPFAFPTRTIYTRREGGGPSGIEQERDEAPE